jgi:hypothetical protein
MTIKGLDMIFNTDFLKIYEELSLFYEGRQPNGMPTLKLSSVIGVDESGPIIGTSSEEQSSMLTFVDIELTRKDNNSDERLFKLPENPNDWAVGSQVKVCATKPGCIHYVIRCSNPNCPMPHRRETVTANTLYKRIITAARNIKKKKLEGSIDNLEKSATEIMYCQNCSANLALGRKNSRALSDFSITEIGDITDGGIITTSDSNNSLLKYLNKQSTIDNNEVILDDPSTWRIFDNTSPITFYFNCTNCGILHAKTASQCIHRYKNMKLYKTLNSKEAFAVCDSCAKAKINDDSTDSTRIDFSLSSDKSRRLKERILPELVVGSTLDEDAAISKDFIEEIIKQNSSSNNSQVKTFLDELSFTLTYDKEPKVKIFKRLSMGSRVKLPCKCSNKDCVKANGKAVEYWASPKRIVDNAYLGCPKCLDLSKGSQTSVSEGLLREAIEEVFQVTHRKTTRIGYYKDIDILFTYKGHDFGIEYDGSYYHKDARTIDADESKVRIFTEQQGINFIRVREAGCHGFDTNKAPAHIIEIPIGFYDIVKRKRKEELIECITKIGKYLDGDDYKIPDNKLKFLTDNFLKV